MTQVPIGPAITIQEGPREGAHAAIVAMHAAYYSKAWGFGPFFAAKVSDELAAFVARYDRAHDRLIVAVTDTGIVGSLVVDGGEGGDAGTAHLRWFIVDDSNRGQGVGRTLMDAGMAFIRSAGFERCYLTTFAGSMPPAGNTNAQVSSWSASNRRKRGARRS
jgi:ribosomal protein S18 acetylase RimI-like enzyme